MLAYLGMLLQVIRYDSWYSWPVLARQIATLHGGPECLSLISGISVKTSVCGSVVVQRLPRSSEPRPVKS